MSLIEKPKGASDLGAWRVPLCPWNSDAAPVAGEHKTFCNAKRTAENPAGTR